MGKAWCGGRRAGALDAGFWEGDDFGAAGAVEEAVELGKALGFTLVEVMVVLALLALLAGLAAPNLVRLVEGFERAAERGRILDQVAGLGERAMLEGAGLVLLGSDPGADGEVPGRFSHYRRLRPEVAQGWRVAVAPPLVVHANGVCLGAVVELGEEDGQGGEIVELEAPHCRVEGR